MCKKNTAWLPTCAGLSFLEICFEYLNHMVYLDQFNLHDKQLFSLKDKIDVTLYKFIVIVYLLMNLMLTFYFYTVFKRYQYIKEEEVEEQFNT